MSRYCVATMDSRDGWETTSPPNAISRHVTYWFASREDQDKLVGGVPSFYALFQKYGQVPETLEKEITDRFKSYLEELFDDVAVAVHRQNITDETNNYRLILSARVTVDNQKYDLAETILVTGELYKRITDARFKQ